MCRMHLLKKKKKKQCSLLQGDKICSSHTAKCNVVLLCLFALKGKRNELNLGAQNGCCIVQHATVGTATPPSLPGLFAEMLPLSFPAVWRGRAVTEVGDCGTGCSVAAHSCSFFCTFHNSLLLVSGAMRAARGSIT